MIEIIPNLWIGDIGDANNNMGLNGKGITAIVNISKGMQNVKVKYEHSIPINGENADRVEELYRYALSVTEIIDNYLISNIKVLVCCENGRQLSPTVVACYLIKYGLMEQDVAVTAIKTKYANAFLPNNVFTNTLNMFYNLVNK
jgi:protein-tyrosine phosphatase